MKTPSNTIECEVRSLLTLDQYQHLKDFFDANARHLGEDKQETRYFGGEQDLRIQLNDHYAKVWLKKGKMHDDAREEIEIRVAKNKFKDLERLFEALGYETAIVWLRHRISYNWEGISVALDHTKGYGYVLELEKMSDPESRIETLDVLRRRLDKLGLKPTPKPVLHERFSYYRDHWKELIAETAKTEAEAAAETPSADGAKSETAEVKAESKEVAVKVTVTKDAEAAAPAEAAPVEVTKVEARMEAEAAAETEVVAEATVEEVKAVIETIIETDPDTELENAVKAVEAKIEAKHKELEKTPA